MSIWRPGQRPTSASFVKIENRIVRAGHRLTGFFPIDCNCEVVIGKADIEKEIVVWGLVWIVQEVKPGVLPKDRL